MPSLYEITVPVFIKKLQLLAAMLNKGHEHVGEAKLSTLLESRLIEDMQPLIFQIRKFSSPSNPLHLLPTNPFIQKGSATPAKASPCDLASL